MEHSRRQCSTQDEPCGHTSSLYASNLQSIFPANDHSRSAFTICSIADSGSISDPGPTVSTSRTTDSLTIPPFSLPSPFRPRSAGSIFRSASLIVARDMGRRFRRSLMKILKKPSTQPPSGISAPRLSMASFVQPKSRKMSNTVACSCSRAAAASRSTTCGTPPRSTPPSAGERDGEAATVISDDSDNSFPLPAINFEFRTTTCSGSISPAF